MDTVVNVIRLDVNWCIAIKLSRAEKDILILNVYAPYKCNNNEEEYLDKLGFISSFLQNDRSCSVVALLGT